MKFRTYNRFLVIRGGNWIHFSAVSKQKENLFFQERTAKKTKRKMAFCF